MSNLSLTLDTLSLLLYMRVYYAFFLRRLYTYIFFMHPSNYRIRRSEKCYHLTSPSNYGATSHHQTRRGARLRSSFFSLLFFCPAIVNRRLESFQYPLAHFVFFIFGSAARAENNNKSELSCQSRDGSRWKARRR